MADDPKQAGKQEDQRININQDRELTCRKFGVTRDPLREAVAKAGPMAKNVEQRHG
jgi:hypothetical protein